MKLLFATALLPVLVTPRLANPQNTRGRATPQTQSAAPSVRNGADGTRGSQPGVRSHASPGATSATRGEARRGNPLTRSTTPAQAPDSSQQSQSPSSNTGLPGGSAVLPGISIPHNALGIVPGTQITVRLQQAVSSGEAKNGDTVHAVLAQPLGSMPTGAPVELTVVAAAKAGEISSGGVLSLQIIRINGTQFLSQIITAEGKEGQKLLPDDAPARGAEAEFRQGQPITLPTA